MANSEADNFLENMRSLLKLSHISGVVNTKEKYSIQQNLNRNRGLRNYVLKNAKKTPNNGRPAKIIRETKSHLGRNLNQYQASQLPPTIQSNTISTLNSTKTPTLANFQQSMTQMPQQISTPTPTVPIQPPPQPSTQSSPGIFETIKNMFTPRPTESVPAPKVVMAPAPAPMVSSLDQPVTQTLATVSPQLGGKRRRSKTKKTKKRKY